MTANYVPLFSPHALAGDRAEAPTSAIERQRASTYSPTRSRSR